MSIIQIFGLFSSSHLNAPSLIPVSVIYQDYAGTLESDTSDK